MTEPHRHHQHYHPVLDNREEDEDEVHRMQEFHALCHRLAANDPLVSTVETGEGGCIELRNDEEAALLANSLQGNTNVQVLALGLLGVSVRGAAYLQHFLYSSESLFSVCLDGSFMDGDTGIIPEEVSIVHVLIYAAMQNCNEISLHLSNCPVARSSLMAVVGISSNIGRIGVTNCILVEDQKDYDPAIHMKTFQFSETLEGLSYVQDISPGRECEMHGMMTMGRLLSQICTRLPTVDLRVDLGDACCCGGFDWSLLLPTAANLSTIHYRMGEHENCEAFQNVLAKADGLEELHFEMPSQFGASREKILALTEAITSNSSLASADIRLRRSDALEGPMRCHIPQVEAHCARNRQFLELWTDLRVDIPAHAFSDAAVLAFKSQRGRLVLSDRIMKQFVIRRD